jgi:hypothetical protein
MSMSEQPDDVWRRPDEQPTAPQDPATERRYSGPPPTTPPAAGWRPPLLTPTAPPRSLPILDEDAIDEAEQRARRITHAIGYGAVTVLLVVALAKLLL